MLSLGVGTKEVPFSRQDKSRFETSHVLNVSCMAPKESTETCGTDRSGQGRFSACARRKKERKTIRKVHAHTHEKESNHWLASPRHTHNQKRKTICNSHHHTSETNGQTTFPKATAERTTYITIHIIRVDVYNTQTTHLRTTQSTNNGNNCICHQSFTTTTTTTTKR